MSEAVDDTITMVGPFDTPDSAQGASQRDVERAVLDAERELVESDLETVDTEVWA